MNNHNVNHNLTLSAMFAALIAITTAYLFHIPTPTGYVHLGDAFIYLSACFLPMPYAMAAAALGGSLADGVTGALIWVIPTFIIKALNVLPFTYKSNKIICRQNVIAVFASGIITFLGYGVAEMILFQSAWAPLAGLPSFLFQSGGSAIVFLIMGYAMDKVELKQKLFHQKFGGTM